MNNNVGKKNKVSGQRPKKKQKKNNGRDKSKKEEEVQGKERKVSRSTSPIG
jgi:hypothetical protein